MLEIFGILFGLLFFVLAWKRFGWAVFLFCASLLTYLVRLNYFGLPTTVLEIMWGAMVLVWGIKFARRDWVEIKNFLFKNKVAGLLVILFLVVSAGEIFVGDLWFKSFGLWRAYFLEPVILFFVLIGRSRELNWRFPVFGLATSGVLISLLALVQKVVPSLRAPSLWDDNTFGRVTSFFTTANAIGLFLVPVVPLLVWLLVEFWRAKKKMLFGVNLVVLAICLAALFFSFSQGAWVALLAAFLVFLFFIGYRKVAILLVLCGVIFAFAVPSVREAVLFADRAGQNRLTLWTDSVEYLTASPKNFVLGTGVRQFFRTIEKHKYDPKVMERLIYPHNVFLNFWTETGLLGVGSFVGMMMVLVGWILRHKDKPLRAIFAAIWVGFLVHGLVDVPYFKNDLAFLFWIMFFVSWYFLKSEYFAVKK